MNMKMMVVAAAAALAAMDATAQGIPSSRTPEQRARMLAAKARRTAAEGGVVEKPASGNIIRFVNAQKRVADEAVFTVAGNIARSLMARHEAENLEAAGMSPIELAAAALAKPKTGVAVVFVDDGKLPSLLAAPEEGWCVVNVGKLAADLPPEDILQKRMRKEAWRAAAIVLGGINSQMTPCAMTDIHKPSDLDAVPIDAVSPEVVMKMLSSMTTRNIQPRLVTTYRRACVEGWAPAPTNDVQKAIWEKVHAVPKNPMKIEFDPKKGK